MTTTVRRQTPLARMMRDSERKFPELLLPGEIAMLFRVDPKTVLKYIYGDKFPEGSVIVTPGNHHRVYRWGVVQAILEENQKRPDNSLTEQGVQEMVDYTKKVYAQRRAGLRSQKEE